MRHLKEVAVVVVVEEEEVVEVVKARVVEAKDRQSGSVIIADRPITSCENIKLRASRKRGPITKRRKLRQRQRKATRQGPENRVKLHLCLSSKR